MKRILFKILIGIIILSILSYIIYVKNQDVINRHIKIKKIEKIYSTFIKEGTHDGELAVELSKMRKDNDSKVVEKANKYYENMLKNLNDEDIINRTRKFLSNMNDQYKEVYIEDLKGIKEDSLYYAEAQALITQLNGNNKINTKITIVDHTEHYSVGKEELNIKIKNTSGKDIRYLALDILEIDKYGSVVNSDWTNTSALILDNATVSIDTYFDYQKSDSSLEFRVREIRYK